MYADGKVLMQKGILCRDVVWESGPKWRQSACLGGERHAALGEGLRGGRVLLHVLPDVLHAHLRQVRPSTGYILSKMNDWLSLAEVKCTHEWARPMQHKQMLATATCQKREVA
jgi:hypothetical protein